MKSIFSNFSEKGFSEELVEIVKCWIIYKKERKQTYKLMGLKQLLSKITESVKVHGEDKVIDVIKFTMSSNYDGITWDRLEKAVQKEPRNPNENIFAKMLREGYGES